MRWRRGRSRRAKPTFTDADRELIAWVRSLRPSPGRRESARGGAPPLQCTALTRCTPGSYEEKDH
ncbi:hypothetical protein GCM10010124_02130 [Pilimelia terevasa]|uniref:Uncharacterized protein n=1 Tax=Pilimelia terevasa TaxID=53372 RepID=A0A8J3FH79_9ACTN|nr:hypothetical protein GCM10010124_02130 [Pilimelia terevasa]